MRRVLRRVWWRVQRHLRPLPGVHFYIRGKLFGLVLCRLFFQRLLRRVVRSVLRAAVGGADAAALIQSIISAVVAALTNTDDGATDVVHAFGQAERRAVDGGAFSKAVFSTYVSADRVAVTCASTWPCAAALP